MRIRELLKKEGIALGVKVDSKDAAIDYLIDLHAKSGNITDKAEFKKGILAREESGSTGVGEGIAIPHSKNAAVKQPGLAAMTVPDGVDYDSLDGQPANLFFMIAAPEKGADVHLEVLSRLSMLLMDENFRAELLAAKNADQFLDICSKYEMEKFADELGEATEDKKENAPEKTGYRVLAVTACPTGIAHTFMAAEALEKKGNEIHITSKGKQLLELVPEDLKKAELTADWEKKLTAISKGKQNDQKFMREISDYTQALIKDIKTSDGKFRHDNVTRHRCPECGKFLLEVNGKHGKRLVCQDRTCGYKKTISRITNARCPVCHKKMEMVGEGEGQKFVCVCGYKEKLSAFKQRKEKQGSGMSKKEVNRYLKKQQKEAEQPINNAFAEAFAKIKL